MTIAVPFSRNLVTPAPGFVSMGRIAAVEVFDDIARAQPLWRAMLRNGAIATPYQQYDFASLWYHHVGRNAGAEPFIVGAWDAAGSPVLMWPLALANCGPARVLGFLGGKHTNLNLAVWRPDFAATATRGEIEGVVARVAGQEPRIDLIALHRQPFQWDGIANPFILLSYDQAADDGRLLELHAASPDEIGGQIHGTLRKQVRAKYRRLAALPGYRYHRLAAPADVERVLDWFFPMKARHLTTQGVANVFAEPGIEEFVRAACGDGLCNGRPIIELHVIECDSEILAVVGGVGDGTRFSSMFNTYTLGEQARQSPGLVLLMQLLDNLAARGYQAFDLGVGDARYKRMFCRQLEPLFDTYLPLTPLGRVTGTVMRACHSIKREIKRRPTLWSAAQMLRRYF